MAAIIVVLFINNIRLVVSKKKLMADALQLAVDKVTIMEKLSELSVVNQTKSVEQTDGFLKFVSESRDWAFDYIEAVQDAIREYDIALSNHDATAMNDAYNKLIDMLPEDDDVVK
jgi:hypothetical protein